MDIVFFTSKHRAGEADGEAAEKSAVEEIAHVWAARVAEPSRRRTEPKRLAADAAKTCRCREGSCGAARGKAERVELERQHSEQERLAAEVALREVTRKQRWRRPSRCNPRELLTLLRLRTKQGQLPAEAAQRELAQRAAQENAACVDGGAVWAVEDTAGDKMIIADPVRQRPAFDVLLLLLTYCFGLL